MYIKYWKSEMIGMNKDLLNNTYYAFKIEQVSKIQIFNRVIETEIIKTGRLNIDGCQGLRYAKH